MRIFRSRLQIVAKKLGNGDYVKSHFIQASQKNDRRLVCIVVDVVHQDDVAVLNVLQSVVD